MNLKPPGSSYTREELASLKRADIQRLCKDYGVRANMKTGALVELLLDSIQSNLAPLIPPPMLPANTTRRISTRSSSRVSSLRTRGASGSSTSTSKDASDAPTTSKYVYSRAPSRQRKSRVTQYKLGVGRPTELGGTGARRSSSGRSRQMRFGRYFGPLEEIIDEESTSEANALPHLAPVTHASNEVHQNSPSIQIDDISSRLAHIESSIKEISQKDLGSLKDFLGQVAWIKSLVERREAEINALRKELNECKAEVMVLREEVAKIPMLQEQLSVIQQYLEQSPAVVSNANLKGKQPRRVSTPFAESNINPPGGIPSIPVQVPQTDIGGSSAQPVPLPHFSPKALAKRVREASCSDPGASSDQREDVESAESDNAKRPARPERKRARLIQGRRPLQEKLIGPLSRPGEPWRECNDEPVTSSGMSSGPSVSTPPPLNNIARTVGESIDATNNDDGQKDLYNAHDRTFSFNFQQVTSSTPRDDVYHYFEAQFSPGSALKLVRADTSTESAATSRSHIPRTETRRISNTVARPRTPVRLSGPERFRLDTSTESSVQADIVSPFDPYDDDAYTLPFGPHVRQQQANPPQNITPTQAGMMPASSMPMPLALAFGLGTMAAGSLPDTSPINSAPRTMYGTELQNDTRFGDFGRDGIATSSAQFWGF